MKARNIGLTLTMLTALVACGGGGDSGSGSQTLPSANNSSKTKAEGNYSASFLTVPASVPTGGSIPITVRLGFVGTFTPDLTSNSITFPVQVYDNGTLVKTQNVTLGLLIGDRSGGTFSTDATVTLTAQAVGVHSIGIKVDPSSAYDALGNIPPIQYTSVTVTP